MGSFLSVGFARSQGATVPVRFGEGEKVPSTKPAWAQLPGEAKAQGLVTVAAEGFSPPETAVRINFRPKRSWFMAQARILERARQALEAFRKQAVQPAVGLTERDMRMVDAAIAQVTQDIETYRPTVDKLKGRGVLTPEEEHGLVRAAIRAKHRVEQALNQELRLLFELQESGSAPNLEPDRLFEALATIPAFSTYNAQATAPERLITGAINTLLETISQTMTAPAPLATPPDRNPEALARLLEALPTNSGVKH